MGRWLDVSIGLVLAWLVLGSAPANAARYALDVAADLGSVRVEATFDGPVQRLRARRASSGDLLQVETCTGEPLRYSLRGGGRLRLQRPMRCLRYRALLRGVERGGMQGDGAVLSNIRQWFWLPSLAAQERVQVRLRLPAGMQASVPWLEAAGLHEFGASPGSGDALALFGRFPQLTVRAADDVLQVAVAGAGVAPEDLRIWEQWLAAAAADVAAVADGFPNPAAQVLLVPADTRGSGSPVPFGHVIRDMGEAVRFFVEPGRSLTDYLGDWTASHEFAHLLLPYVDDKWVSEGFASYYQNRLMAARGSYTPVEMWQRLSRSFARADAIERPPTLMGLQDEEFWRVRMLVYWSGAAIALLADAELRRLSDGAESLDVVLARLVNCCLPHPRTLSGEAFFEWLDQHTRYPVFSGLYEQFAHAPGQPSVTALFAELGVESPSGFGAGPVTLNDAAPLAWVRRGMEGSVRVDRPDLPTE